MGKGLILLCLIAGGALAADVRSYIPEQAKLYASTLAAVQGVAWASAPEPWTLGGQVEQESCITLTHKRCWNPRAELKTSREYGFGFGQITIAYKADGSERFNNFKGLKAQHASLKDWAWENRYDPKFQLDALVEMDRTLFTQIRDAATPTDQLAFMLAGYNGGQGGVLQDRRLCSNTGTCDARRWFGNVETTSLKTRRVNPGYGQSAYDINRGYVRLILQVRRDKYKVFWEAE